MAVRMIKNGKNKKYRNTHNSSHEKRHRVLWIVLYLLYIAFIILSLTAFNAEHNLRSRASGIYEYTITYDSKIDSAEHYTINLVSESQVGKMHVIFNADSGDLYVETTNIKDLTIDCRSIAEEKTEEILGKDYQDNPNAYKKYFVEELGIFTVTVVTDYHINLTFKDVPYPSTVTVNNKELEEGEDYNYRNGRITGSEVNKGKSVVKITFDERTSEYALASFKTNNRDNYHIPNTDIEFDASGSTGNILDYIWDMGNGVYKTESLPIMTYRYDKAGIYDVILVVRDGSGDISRTMNTIYVSDIDMDNLPDDWERRYLGSLLQDDDDDKDGDGLSNADEYFHGTNPAESDSDHDGFSDKVEIDKNTDPNDSKDKPKSEKKVDTGMFGLGKIGGIDTIIIIMLIIIIILVVAFIFLMRKKAKRVEKIPREKEKKMIVRVPTAAPEEEIVKEPVAEEYNCPECGAPILEDQPECDECGATLEWEEEGAGDELYEDKDELEKGLWDRGEPVEPGELGVEAAVEPAPVPEPIEEEEFECPTCGASVNKDDIVCPTCGEEFE